MAAVTCPKCGSLTSQAGFPAWVIIVAICFFPVGLLALLAGASDADGDQLRVLGLTASSGTLAPVEGGWMYTAERGDPREVVFSFAIGDEIAGGVGGRTRNALELIEPVGLLFAGANDYAITGGTLLTGSNVATNSDLIIQQYGAGKLTITSAIPNSFGASTLTKAGTGVLVVEHHPDLIFDICHHVTVLNLGKILAAGTPAEIRAHREVVNAYLGA